MTEALAKNFASENFNPEKFVKDLSSHCVGADGLRQQRAKIQELADKTSAQLKKNVYENYMQFIETAKEIAHLESEMYQLSQLLGEQRALLGSISSMANGVVLDGALENQTEISNEHSVKEEDLKQKLKLLLENVEGAMSLIDAPGRVCLHEGSLLELDPLEGTPLKRIHAYLFNDCIAIASWLATGGRRGPPRFKLQAVYDLQNIAVVNVRDLGTVKLAFKLLAFPDTRVFQCSTATSKKEWLDKCDQAKKARLAQEHKSESPEKVSKEETSLIPSRSISIDSNNLGLDDPQEDLDENIEPPPEWMLEVTEDLDSYIAQRHFEEAFVLLEKARAYLKESPHHAELKTKLNERTNRLVEVLTKELEQSAEAKSLQGGGLRSARRAVRLLIELERSAPACQLYLKLCNAALKARLKRVKREGATVPYVEQLSAIAFSNIVEMSRDFLKIFPPETNCTSALIDWCSQEIKHLTSHLIKQMFIPQVTLGTLVECVSTIRRHCDQLIEFGMDFRYQLDGQLRSPLVRALQDTGEKYVDAVKLRASEDTWRPYNLQTSQNMKKLLAELDDLHVEIPAQYQTSDCWITITSNTVAFAKLYVGLLEDCLSVMTPELLKTISDVLVSVMNAQVLHVVSALNNHKIKEKKLVQDNAMYLQSVIIPRGLELYKSVTGQPFKRLIQLQEKITFVPVSSPKPKPMPRTSIQKYSTNEYL